MCALLRHQNNYMCMTKVLTQMMTERTRKVECCVFRMWVVLVSGLVI